VTRTGLSKVNSVLEPLKA